MLALWSLVPRPLQQALAALAFMMIVAYAIAFAFATIIGGLACCS